MLGVFLDQKNFRGISTAEIFNRSSNLPTLFRILNVLK